VIFTIVDLYVLTSKGDIRALKSNGKYWATILHIQKNDGCFMAYMMENYELEVLS